MHWNKHLYAAIGMAMMTAPAAAQEFVIPWSSIDSGGGPVEAGAFELIGAIGQLDAGRLQGGEFEILGGFFAGANTILGCSVADVSEPFGALNFFDVATFISFYNDGDSIADFAAPFGVLNFFDVVEYISAYNAGCP